MKDRKRFAPDLCLTHNCNLNCIYCYQKHDINNRMSFETAKKSINWIFENIPEDMNEVEIDFIGGEPLLEFELIKKIYDYVVYEFKPKVPFIFFATTNGTVMTPEMKEWFLERKDMFCLGVSLDGMPDTHNHNRSNSFDKIDIDFFIKNWPEQGTKMTLSEYSLNNLADNIIYLHDIGCSTINGVNLFEGTFDWSDEKYIKILIPQLEKLVAYYVENDELEINQMLNKSLGRCEAKEKKKHKWCGIGTTAIFFETDGTRRPCPFCTSMTFSKEELEKIQQTDFTNEDNFVDDECFNNCYIYPICPKCAGANYLTQKSFSKWDKSKCRIQKLITLYSADLQAKRLIKNPERYDEYERNRLINAIQKIRELYLPEFKDYL